MRDDVLLVFSNYNGCRNSNNVKDPRISITMDSFLKVVPNYESWNALLLDNNSTDGSHNILKKYRSDKWIYRRKKKEDFYLGTLKSILDEFYEQYKYILVVDNDQCFFRSGFLETAVAVMDENKNIINIQLNDINRADFRDKYGHDRGIVGIFDSAGVANDEIWMKSTKYRGQSWWNTKKGRVKVKKKNLGKRDCWMWWGSSNTLLRSAVVRKIFFSKSMKPPFQNNSDRLSQFARALNSHGDTAFLERGGSFNFGFRKKLAKSFDLQKYLTNQPKEDSLFVNDDYSFFDDNGTIRPISVLLGKVETSNLGGCNENI